MRGLLQFAAIFLIANLTTGVVSPQDLAPRAYIITPCHTNVLTLTWSFYDGGVNFNGTQSQNPGGRSWLWPYRHSWFGLALAKA